MKTSFPRHELQAATAAALALWLTALVANGHTTEPRELSVAHDEYVYMIRFSPDGKTVATAAGDNVARVWNWSSQELLHTLQHDSAVYGAVFAPGGNMIATGSGEGEVALWNAANGKLVTKQKEHADAIYCLSFAPDGRTLATIGGDGKKGDTRCRIWSIPNFRIENVLPGHDRPGYGVLFGPTVGKARPLVTSGGDKLIHIYDGNVADSLANSVTDSRVTLKGHTSDVYRCCFSPTGEQLASTSQDGTVRIWNVVAAGPSRTIFKSRDPTYDVAYSADGRLIAAVGDDGFVRFWNTETYELVGEFKVDKEGLYSVVFTPDQANVLTGGVRGKIYACPVPKIDAQ